MSTVAACSWLTRWPARGAACRHRRARWCGPLWHTDDGTPMRDTVLVEYARRLREQGAIRSDPLERAFATVPRHRFLGRIATSRLGPVDVPYEGRLSDDLTALIYGEDDALVTRVVDGMPTSSSTQPSLMAIMLEALELAPGVRVLEIG